MTTGCVHAAPPFALAGIVYDANKSLEATEKPLFDTKNPPKIRNYAVRYIGSENEAVPAILTLPADTATPVPCVLLLHGLGGNKAQVAVLGLALARKGYASLSIDIAGHGERKLTDGKPIEEWELTQIRHACAETAVDLRRAVDYLQTRKDIDSNRLGFAGASLGGIIGSLFVPNEPRIKAAALWAAGGNWAKISAESQVSLAKRIRSHNQPNQAIADAAKIAAQMADVDPLTYIALAKPRPILFLNGDNDTIVPTACAKLLTAAAKDVKKAVLIPGGHIPDLPLMVTQTIDWMDRYVKSIKN